MTDDPNRGNIVEVKNITIVFWNDEINGGEYEAAFDGSKFLDAWHTNDALWRGEYYDGFLAKLGVIITYNSDPTLMQVEAIKNHFGFN